MHDNTPIFQTVLNYLALYLHISVASAWAEHHSQFIKFKVVIKILIHHIFTNFEPHFIFSDKYSIAFRVRFLFCILQQVQNSLICIWHFIFLKKKIIFPLVTICIYEKWSRCNQSILFFSIWEASLMCIFLKNNIHITVYMLSVIVQKKKKRQIYRDKLRIEMLTNSQDSPKMTEQQRNILVK